MIDLNALAVQDSHDILNGELGVGSFAVDLLITDLTTPVAHQQTIKGHYDDVGLVAINFETNMPLTGSKISVRFHQSDLTIWNGTDSLQRWKVSFTNGAGQLINAEMNNIIPDRSFGDVLVMCQIVDGH